MLVSVCHILYIDLYLAGGWCGLEGITGTGSLGGTAETEAMEVVEVSGADFEDVDRELSEKKKTTLDFPFLSGTK